MAQAGPRAGAIRSAAATADAAAAAARSADLFAMLADRETAPPDDRAAGRSVSGMGPQTLRAFRAGSSYGTRCSTVLTISNDAALLIAERRFDAGGAAAGQSEHLLNGVERVDVVRECARNPRAGAGLSLES